MQINLTQAQVKNYVKTYEEIKDLIDCYINDLSMKLADGNAKRREVTMLNPSLMYCDPYDFAFHNLSQFQQIVNLMKQFKEHSNRSLVIDQDEALILDHMLDTNYLAEKYSSTIDEIDQCMEKDQFLASKYRQKRDLKPKKKSWWKLWKFFG